MMKEVFKYETRFVAPMFLIILYLKRKFQEGPTVYFVRSESLLSLIRPKRKEYTLLLRNGCCIKWTKLCMIPDTVITFSHDGIKE